MPIHRRESDLDPEIAALGRVKLSSWKVLVTTFAWLFGLSGTVAATAAAVTHKLDRDEAALMRQADRDLLVVKLEAMESRLAKIEGYQERQAAAQEESARIAAAIRQAGRK